MRKINLLYVITKLELGGAQKQLLSLINGLPKDQFDIWLFTASEGLLMEEASSIAGVRIHRSPWLERPIHPCKDLLAIIEIYRFIKKNRIDVVHTHSSKAGVLGRLAARMAGAKSILHTIHGWSFHGHQFLVNRIIFQWLERLLAGCTDCLIVVSDYDRRKGLHCGIGREDKYVVIPYGIDYNSFRVREKQDLKETLGISAADSVVTMVSCFKPQKSPVDFIRLAFLVCKEFDTVKFLLVGDGLLRESIERLVGKWNLRSKVTLLGWRRDIPQILSVTDVVVLTSLWEGMPIAVLEAMAAARPVIATDTGAVREIVKEAQTGYLVKAGDILKMSRRLLALLKAPSVGVRIGEGGRGSLGETYTLQHMVRLTQDVYFDLARTKLSKYAH